MFMRKIRADERGFEAFVASLEERGQQDFGSVEARVRGIIDEVRRDGDAALVSMAARFDGGGVTASNLAVTPEEIRAARRAADPEAVKILEEASRRIQAFHNQQLKRSWFVSDQEGTLLGQSVAPVASAGLYVPGGKAAYPSTVLMNAIPARVAGVERIIICTPAAGGKVHPLVVAAADLLGITEIYKTGGAQAVAAMAYGTRTIRKVDKIVGPGNIWVATAKRAVYGTVSIDSLAGPSEIFIIADAGADASFIAADLLSQAEHDQMATCVLLTDSPALADKVEKELGTQLAALERRAVAEESLKTRGATVIVKGIEAAVDLANRLGPEHLEILTADPLGWLPKVRYAGSVFFGPWTPEPLGDYMAGPNHVLPTGGAARFSSGLGVEDFLVRSNILCFGPEGFSRLADPVARFADLEGLTAHARAVRIRPRA